MTTHRKFLNELRVPVRNYNKKMRRQHQRKTDMPQAEDTSIVDKDELMRELEAKFDELFGSDDE